MAPARLTGFQDYTEVDTEKKVPVFFNLQKSALCLFKASVY